MLYPRPSFEYGGWSMDANDISPLRAASMQPAKQSDKDDK